jgi:hypothetical protein
VSIPHEAGWQGEGAAGSCGDEPQRAGAARPADCHRGCSIHHGLAACGSDTRIPTHLLPLRYNYPNQPEFDLARSGELESIRFLHCLRSQIVQREADFATMETIEKMAARTDLSGSNELFRRRFAELLPSVAEAGLYSNKQDVR